MDSLLAITLVLAVMVLAIIRKANLDATMLIGVALTAVFFGRAGQLIQDSADTLADPKTIELMLLVCMVFLMNNILSSSGAMKRVVDSFDHMISDSRVTIAAIPVVIGLMPVPSGAVLSAPFADEIGEKMKLPRETRHALNYWFRHISEYVNPIYPGVLLAISILGLTLQQFFIANLPVMLFYVLCGIVFFLAKIRNHHNKPGKITLKHLTTAAKGIAPILLAVALPVAFNTNLILSLIAAVTLAVAINPKPDKTPWQLIKDSVKPDLLILVYLVMLFNTVLDHSEATKQISDSILALGVPHTILIILVPSLVGFLTGLTIGFVGLTFPILLPILAPGGNPDMHLITLAYVSGYLGILSSPMHLCFSVTQKYFKTDLRKSYKTIMPPIILVFLFTLAYTQLT